MTSTDPNCYEYDAGCYSIYGFEYQPGFEDGVSASRAVSIYVRADAGVTAVHHLDIEQPGVVDAERARHGPRPARRHPGAARPARAHGASLPAKRAALRSVDGTLTLPLFRSSSLSLARTLQYIIANLGMSYNFGPVDLADLPFPVHLRVDYVRVYQPADAVNIGCDPADYPTADYIQQYIEAYTNPNLTTWTGDYGQPWPKNSFLGEC